MRSALENGIKPTVLAVPRLESGDRLTRAEFERRYEAMPHIKKAELIEGVVYMLTRHFAKWTEQKPNRMS